MCLARPFSTQNSNAANLSAKYHPGKSARRGRRELKYVQILSQNTQGFNEDKEEIILALMQQKNIFAYAIQETWRLGNGISEKYGYYIIQHGSDSKPPKGHPSGGVAIILSPDAVRAWIKAGSCVLHFGNRILAIKLEMEDTTGKSVTVMFATAYSPIGAAQENVRQVFAADMEKLMEAPKSNEVLLICIDANASLGTRTHAHDRVMGPFGVDRVNSAGRELHDLLDSKGLCSATTFFKKSAYGTWRHPRSKNAHQLDHVLLPRGDLSRVRDAGIYKQGTVESDHAPLQIKLRIARNLSKQNVSSGKFTSRELLRNPEIASAFRLKVLAHLGIQSSTPSSGQHGRSYSDLKEAATTAAGAVLTTSERRRPGWFNENQLALMSAINTRNNAQRDYDRRCKPGEPKPHPECEMLRLSRKMLKLTIVHAKNSWMANKIEGLGQGNKHPKEYWNCVNSIKLRLNGHSKKVSEQLFRNKDGEICSNVEENAKTVQEHFQKVYNIQNQLDPTVFDLVRQRPIRVELDDPPTLEEIRKALNSAKKDKAAGDSKIPVEFWQVLSADTSTENLFHDIILQVWDTGECDAEWLTNRLKILPKKGDLRNLDNWRGIMLIESPVKVITSILASRISVHVLETEGLEEQNGFMRQRGCCDGIFTVKLALQKRHEHGLGTWAVFIDLVKAFDSVPRDGLYIILGKLGIPPKMTRLIMRFHSDLIVKIKVGEADVLFDSITGVKQGCTGAPTFFNVYFQVANEVVDLLTLAPSLQFKTKQDHVFTGRSIQTHSAIDFSFDKSLYADDKTKLYATRMQLQEGMQLIYTVFKRFGLTCHVGRNNAKSKTEAMYFPPPGVRYEDADTSPLLIDTGEDTGKISFTPTFKLLGSTLAKNLKDDTEVELRIKSAQGAFSAIRKQFFSAKGINNTHKKIAYEGLILSILLYGCETWSLPKQVLNRLQLFHNNCVRAMCRVSMWHVREHRITQANLEHRLQREPFKFYLARRRLRWAGHVLRMPMTRLPRMFLSSWVDHKRPQQRPRFNYGHGLGRDLRNAGVKISDWGFLANDRTLWHAITQQKNRHCNTNGSGYIWVDPELLEQAAAQRTLPPPLSYAGVLLGLLPSPDAPTPVAPSSPPPANQIIPLIMPQTTHSTTPSPSPSSPILVPNHAPQRCSRRLANQAELAGGRKVYSHTQAPRIPLR